MTATYINLEVKNNNSGNLNSINTNYKGLMNLVMANPQEFFKQQLIKNEDQKPSFSKRNSAHFGELTM